MGVLLAFILILTGLHLALYAKYKSGDFVTVNSNDKERHTLPDIKYVSVTGLVNCYLLSHESIPAIEINKEKGSRISYKVVNDTLFVTGDSTATIEALEQGARNHQLVNLILPAATQIKLAYSTMWLSGSFDSAHAPSYSIELVTQAHIGIMEHEPGISNVFFDSLNLVTNRSTVELNKRPMIGELHVQSFASHIICQQASIRQMTMDFDSTSTVFMQETNLKNLTGILKP